MNRRIAKLRDKLNAALRKERFATALDLYTELETLEPEEPRWPHRKGDLQRRLDQDDLALACYERAVQKYAELGFVARAAAMAKVILQIDSSRIDVLERVDPEAAKALRKPPPVPFAARFSSLAPAPGAPTGEIVFADDEAIELDLSDIELVPRRRQSFESLDIVFLDVEESPQRASIEELSALPSIGLFAGIPAAALRRLVVGAELKELPPGHLLMALGSPADALFVLIEGEAEVHVPGIAEPILVGEGDIVGEGALLQQSRRGADVRAHTSLQALRVPRSLLDELVEAHPELKGVLVDLLGRRLLSNLLRTHPLFVAFDEGNRKELSRLFEIRQGDAGTQIIGRGKRADGLYAVLQGSLSVDGVEAGPGTLLGQPSLLHHRPEEHDVVCTNDVLLLRLPAQRFAEFAATFPTVLEHLASQR